MLYLIDEKSVERVIKVIMIIGFIFAWLPGIIFTAFKFKYADELKDLQWGDGKWEFWIRQTHNILGFIYGLSLYRIVFSLLAK